MSSTIPSICRNLTVYNESILIPFKNVHQYFNKIYFYLKKEIKDMHLECVNIRDIFSGIIRRNNNIFKLKSTNIISDITNDTISLIKLPSLPAEYHFIVAVIHNDLVHIYQAYGNRSIYKMQLPLSVFINYVEKIEKIVSSNIPYSSEVLDDIRDIEKKLYDVSIDKYIEDEIDRTADSDNEDDEDNLEDLKEEYFEEYYEKNWQNSENFSITTYYLLPVKKHKSVSLKRSTKKSKSSTYKKLKSI